MKKLKRMFALTLTLCVVLAAVLPAYADENIRKASSAAGRTFTLLDAAEAEGEITDLDAPNSVVYFEYDPDMKSLFQHEVYDFTLVDSSWTELKLEAGKWYVIEGTVTLQSRVENSSQPSDPANIILTNGCTLNAPYGIENGSRNGLRIYGQDRDGGSGQLKIAGAPDLCAGIGGGASPGEDEQGCGYVEINGGILEIHGGLKAAGIGGGGSKGGVDVSVTINAGKVTAYGGDKGAGIGTGNGSSQEITGNGTITINGGTVEAFGGEWGAGIGRGYHGYANAVVITGGDVTAKGGARGAAGIGGGKDTQGVKTTISGGTVCAIGNVDATYGTIGCGIGHGANNSASKALTISGEQLSILSGTSAADATLTCADTYVRLREPYVRISSAKSPVYIVRHMLQKTDKSGYELFEEDEMSAPVGSMTSASFKSYAGFTPKVLEQVRVSADQVTVVEILYDRNEYTIFFDANGHGRAPAAVTAPYEAPVSAPAQPQEPGYTFIGWFEDQACTKPYTFTADAKMPLNGAILYAGWTESTKPTYTVTWTMDDGTVIGTADVVAGEMPVHADAEKAGCIFTGWTPALAPVTENVTYTARFYALPHEHTFSDDWSCDEANHWHAASCEHAGIAMGIEAHQFGDDNVCDVCHYVKQVPTSTSGLPLYGIEITVPPNKTNYTAGESFDMTGMVVKALYAKSITDYSLSPQVDLKVTDTVITVSYTENGVTKSAQLPITIGSADEPYRIIAGANQTIMTTSDSAVFSSDARFDKFEHVEVDGEEVPKRYYFAESGSTVITLSKEYISTLKEGKHTLRVVSSDGSASTEFTVLNLPATGSSVNPVLLMMLLFAGMGTALYVFFKTRKRIED